MAWSLPRLRALARATWSLLPSRNSSHVKLIRVGTHSNRRTFGRLLAHVVDALAAGLRKLSAIERNGATEGSAHRQSCCEDIAQWQGSVEDDPRKPRCQPVLLCQMEEGKLDSSRRELCERGCSARIDRRDYGSTTHRELNRRSQPLTATHRHYTRGSSCRRSTSARMDG